MILRAPEAVPLEQVLPLFLSNLPLKQDSEENDPVFSCIFLLLRMEHPAVFTFGTYHRLFP